MTARTHSEGQLRWYKAVYLTIVEDIQVKLQTAKPKSSVYQHLRWRLGFNLYNATKYMEAMPILEETARIDDITFSDDANITSHVHQTAGRCAVQLFKESQQHSYLEYAYVHYQNAVQTMVMNLYTMFKLPLLLLEFGRVLEDYGAFEAANDVYARILSGFPNFRGYFDALYRSAIVGRHLASILVDPASKEEALNKCLDILQFLLEALPATISDVRARSLFLHHSVFVTHCLKTSSSIKSCCCTAGRWSCVLIRR
jgi:tetratricopeptide (TPR) repeat protein